MLFSSTRDFDFVETQARREDAAEYLVELRHSAPRVKYNEGPIAERRRGVCRPQQPEQAIDVAQDVL
jgi:hypothetical protein